jgi:hypothetical protein
MDNKPFGLYCPPGSLPPAGWEKPLMSYVGRTDLQNRNWVYTRQGIDYLINHDPKFPPPSFTINGRTKVWLETDIERYEDDHPELFDEMVKRKKVIGYARAQLKKMARKG